MAQQDKLDLGEEKKKSSKSTVFIIIGAVLGTLAAAAAALYFLGIFPPKPDEAAAESQEDESHALPIIYEPMEPALTVNFKSNPDARLLRIGLTVASTNQAVIDGVKKHSPMIRNNLLLLLSSQDPAALKTAEGKEALRGKLLEEINAVVANQTGHQDGVEEIFFTSFIMQ